MSKKISSTRRFSPLRTIVKGALTLFIVVLVLTVGAVVLLPSIISSDFGRNRVIALASENLQRPVSLENLSFSWAKGVDLSNLTIKNADQSPFIDLHELKVKVSWLALAARRVVVDSCLVKGLSVVITRDKSGKTSIDDLLAPTGEAPVQRKAEEATKTLPAVFLDAHLQEGHLTFIDKRLETTTEIRNLRTDVTVRSLIEPIDFLLKGDVVLDNKAPEPLHLTGNALLAPDGIIDPLKAKGTVELKASFGELSLDFDLARFESDQDATGATLACNLDLKKMSELTAGIVGLPPGFSVKGQLKSSLKAQGSLQTSVTISGNTRVNDLLISGGPFKDVPFKEPQLDLVQTVAINPQNNTISMQTFSLKSRMLALTVNGTVRNFQGNPDFDLTVSGNGDLYEMTRVALAMAAVPPGMTVRGGVKLSLSLSGAQEAMHAKGKTSFENLIINAPFLAGRPFAEESLEITHDVTINVPKVVVTLATLQIQGSGLSASAAGVVDGEGTTDVQVKTSALFGQLKKQLGGLLPSAFPSEGTLSSTVSIKGNANTSLVAKGDHTISSTSLVIPSSGPDQSPSPPTTIALPKITLLQELDYSKAGDSLTVKKLTASSDCFTLDGSAAVTQLSKEPLVTSETTVTVALPESLSMFNNLIPKELSAQGDARVQFSSKGKIPASSDKPLLSSWSGNGSLSVGPLSYQGMGTLENLHTTKLTLEAGKASLALECLVSKGLTTVEGTGDFSRPKPAMSVSAEGNDIQVSQNARLLGYMIPLFIAPSGQVTGQGNFSAQASWQGTDWEQEVSRTISGKGVVRVTDGLIRGQGVLLQLLQHFSKAESFAFKEIMTSFRLADGKVYNDKILVDGEDLDFQLQGWTSLSYVAEKDGNPMDYTVSGDFIKGLGGDAQKILSALGGGEQAIPIGIAGTVQNPRVSVKLPKTRDLFQQLLKPSEEKKDQGTEQPRSGTWRDWIDQPVQK